MQGFRTITSDEYAKEYLPLNGFLLVKKDVVPSKYGSILISSETRVAGNKWSATGIVTAKAPFAEHDYERNILKLINIGDRIGFNPTGPFFAPAPTYYEFKNSDGEDDRSVTIHVTDVIAVLKLEKDSIMDKILQYFNEVIL